MQKFLLSKEHIFDLVRENRYRVKDPVRSRCIDGRYKKDNNLPGLTFPGGDAGELLMVFSSGKAYGFEVNRQKAWDALTEVIGGANNFGFHTDSHNVHEGVLAGCGHVKQAALGLKEYNLDKEDMDYVKEASAKARTNGASEIVLEGEHEEGAVVITKGEYSIYPRFTLMDQGHPKQVEIFVYTQTLVDRRHRALAEKLIANKALTLPEGLDAEYLYEVFSEVSENHLMETAKRLAKGLPIYEVVFDSDGLFEIVEMGEV